MEKEIDYKGDAGVQRVQALIPKRDAGVHGVQECQADGVNAIETGLGIIDVIEAGIIEAGLIETVETGIIEAGIIDVIEAGLGGLCQLSEPLLRGQRDRGLGGLDGTDNRANGEES